MKNIARVQLVVAAVACGWSLLPARGAAHVDCSDGSVDCSEWVWPSAYTSRLVYVPDAEGDQIVDFGQVGYRRGLAGLPSDNLPPQGVNTVRNSDEPLATALETDPPQTSGEDICEPGAHDHGMAIQEAINAVASMEPGANGVKGRVFLDRGHYAVWDRPLILKAGVVLRGVSPWSNAAGDPPTTLHACGGSSKPLIHLEEGDKGIIGYGVPVLGETVPVGANSIKVAAHNVSSFFDPNRGSNRVRITRWNTSAWRRLVGTDQLDGWDQNILFERSVVRAEPDGTLFLDEPLTTALESEFGYHWVESYGHHQPMPATGAGVYKLRGESHPYYDDAEDKERGSKTFVFVGSEHSWVYDIVAENFWLSAVELRGRYNTAQRVRYWAPPPSTVPLNGTTRYSFLSSGQMNLFIENEAVGGRHDHIDEAWNPGPNAFVDSSAYDAVLGSGPHQRWASGSLYEGLVLSRADGVSDWLAGGLEVRKRGGNHGWAGANMVIWNVAAEVIPVFNPPGAQNWRVGYTVTRPDQHDQSHRSGDAYSEWRDTTPFPGSLYHRAAQDHSRLSDGRVVEHRQYRIGDYDDFGDFGDTDDAVYVNPAFQAWFGDHTPAIQWTRGLDSVDDHKSVPFSIRFGLAEGEEVIHAVLAVRVKRIGAYHDDGNHLVQLAGAGTNVAEFLAMEDQTPPEAVTYHWGCEDVAGPCQTIPAPATGPLDWGFGSEGKVQVLDLGAHLPLLNRTRQDADGLRIGELNVNFSRRTRVDWAALSITTAKFAP